MHVERRNRPFFCPTYDQPSLTLRWEVRRSAPHSGGWCGGRNVGPAPEVAACVSLQEMVWLPKCGHRETR